MAKKNEDGFEPIEDSIEWIEEKPDNNSGMPKGASFFAPWQFPSDRPPEEVVKNLKSAGQGLAQGAANVGIGYANFLPGVNIPKRNFAPQNPFAEAGEDAAEFGSYFLPGELAKILGKGVRSIPFIANAIKGVIPSLEKRSTLNALTKIGKAGAEGGVASAALGTKEDQGENALAGGALGSGINALTQLATSSNPWVNTVARGLGGGVMGAGIGGLQGDPITGAEIGSSVGLGAPKLSKLLRSPKPDSENILKNFSLSSFDKKLNNKLEAADRLETVLTPGEALESAPLLAKEKKYGRTEAASFEKDKILKERVKNEQNQINSLLDTIYTPPAKGETTINDLYESALNQGPQMAEEKIKGKTTPPNLELKEWEDLIKDNPILTAAEKVVNKKPEYQFWLKKGPGTEYQRLDLIKQELDRRYAELEQYPGSKTLQDAITLAKKELLQEMDKTVGGYKGAREMSGQEQIRRTIQYTLNKKEVNGRNFYREFLLDQNKYQELYDNLKGNPAAQQILKDMKTAWKDLTKLPSVSEIGSNETNNNFIFNKMNQIVGAWEELVEGKKNLETVKYLHSPQWRKEVFNTILKTNAKERSKKLADLLGKAVVASNKPSQGSEKNGTELRTGT